ncbi:hypothetical protein Slin15195_G089070 [Septoria linicola]|uniref:Uncharacterized protein n=1 Tax=Septoria linicola TaxID=215465 RepID=A0A9Q9B0Y1_9PEZI|nr:hypothetical protein Slin15195_G089070 [Septoria linicola]
MLINIIRGSRVGPRLTNQATVSIVKRQGNSTFSTTTARCAVAAKPATPSKLDSADADMWKAYANKMKSAYFPNMDTNSEAFYVAPIGRIGIPSGPGIAAEITNKGVYDCADPMPSLTSGVFGSSVDSFSQRSQLYLGAVRLNRNPDKGALYRLQQAKAKVDKLVSSKTELEKSARAAFGEDEDKGTTTFKQWVPQNFPNLQSLYQELQAASSTVASLTAQVEGPGADQLNRYKTNVYNALDLTTSYSGLNMPVVDLPADKMGDGTLPEGAAKIFRPTYSISSTYADTVENWIGQAGSQDHVDASITYDLASAKSSKWSDVGISEWSAGANAGYGFFQARFTVNGKEVVEQISASQAGSELSVKVSATGIASFEVKPGAWAVPGMEKSYPVLESQNAATFGAAGRVTDVVMGYKVGMSISMSTKTKERVHELTSKAISSGGSVSIFGFRLPFGGAGAGSFSHKTELDQMFVDKDKFGMNIPGLDVNYPVLLGVKATKVPEIKARRV